MEKDFQKWHNLKMTLDEVSVSPLYREREIWWLSLGANIGTEEDGKNDLFERPVIIFRKFNNDIFWGIPLTSKKKDGRFYIAFELHGEIRYGMLSQLRVLSAKRFSRRIGKVSWMQFANIEKAVEKFTNETGPLRGPRVPSGNL